MPVKVMEEKDSLPTQSRKGEVMLIPQNEILTTKSLRANEKEGTNENIIAIMVKDVEEELTTAKLQLSFNPAEVKIADIQPPQFEDSQIKA